MIPRLINPSKTNSFFLFGARGTGKSTFVKQQFLKGSKPDRVMLIDLLLPETEDLYARNPQRLKSEVLAHKQEKKLDWVFIDEVQKVPRLLDVVHHLIEEEKLKFVLTGSSARKLKRGSANLLAGRAFVQPLFPFTATELGSQFDLDRALRWGTLPKVIALSNDSDRMQFLKSYALTYLKEEIQVEQLVRRLDPFRAFLEVAAQCNGTILNFSKIARDIGSVDHKTVVSYFQILEDTHLGFLLPAYSGSIRKALSTHPKFYFFDPGVKRALDQTLDVPLKSKTSAYGDAFEHWVVLEVFRLNQILGRDYRLSYFQSGKSEIDLILSKPSGTIVIEIKSSDRVDPLKVKKVAALASAFDSPQVLYFSQDKTPQVVEGVRCLHWQTGLREIFRF